MFKQEYNVIYNKGMDIIHKTVIKTDPKGDRNITYILIENILNENDRFCGDTKKRKLVIIEEIERGILNHSINICNDLNIIATWDLNYFIDVYKSTRLTVCSIIDKINKFKHIENMIMDKTVNWCDLVSVKPYEIRPDLYTSILLEIKQKEETHMVVSYREDGWICSKCRDTRYKIHLLQTKSSDEPVNEYRICGGCDNRTRG
jgi:DNA-directed RNA polymerase subunit M/transcription elongation factor TFIIS